MPAGVNAKAFSLREGITFGELDANWGEQRTAGADIGTRERGLHARFVDLRHKSDFIVTVARKNCG